MVKDAKGNSIKAGDLVRILNIGHAHNNEHFPAGKTFYILKISDNKFVYVDKSRNVSGIRGTCTDVECVELVYSDYNINEPIKNFEIW